VGVFIFSLNSGNVYADAARLHDIELPANATAKSIATNVVQHGHRMSMAVLLPQSPIEDVLEFYRQLWEQSDSELPGFLEDQSEGWNIISSIDDGWNRVMQIRNSTNGVEAYLSVLEIQPISDRPYRGILPRDGVLVSALSGEEFNKPTQTDVVFSKQREQAVAGFYRNHFNTEGWSIVSDRKVKGSFVLLMQRNGAQAEVVVTSVDDGSVAVLNMVGDNE